MSSALTDQLTPSELTAARALAAAIIPAGRRFRAADDRTISTALELLGGISSAGPRLFGPATLLLDRAAMLRTGRRFSNLVAGEQEKLLRRWSGNPLLRVPLKIIASALKAAHYEDPDIYAALGCEFDKGGPAEDARWLSQIEDGEQWTDDGEELECDVVVMGTGAGGAVVGRELADRGYAVLFIEEGRHYRRDSFRGSALHAHHSFYRDRAGIASFGNAVMPVVMGRLVGGSTAINTATCWRTPDWIADEWCERLGTDALSPENMKPHFERVERELEIAPTDWKYLGRSAELVREGCERLGWNFYRVMRNARDCDAQGVCDFGCPSDGRRSMNITYIPSALQRGAMLFSSMRGERVIIENGRAVGLEARSVTTGATLRVRSRAVILAGGAVPTPLFLLGQGICNQSNQIGRNLSLHPGASVSALFDEKIDCFNSVPQGVCCDQFHEDGMLMLGANAAINVAALTFGLTGQRLTEAMDAYDRVAGLACMIEDDARGRVRRRRNGSPLITYSMTKNDVDRLQRGLGHVMDVFRAAGATRYYPCTPRFPIIETDAELRRFKTARMTARDFIMMSFHPLGTCRMGKDPTTSVVGIDHQTHEVRDLFIVDGSTVPGPPAVNPQLTIMAMATRAAGVIAGHLG